MGIAQAVARWVQQAERNDRHGRHPSGGRDSYRDVVVSADAFRSHYWALGGSIILDLLGGGCISESEHSVG